MGEQVVNVVQKKNPKDNMSIPLTWYPGGFLSCYSSSFIPANVFATAALPFKGQVPPKTWFSSR